MQRDKLARTGKVDRLRAQGLGYLKILDLGEGSSQVGQDAGQIQYRVAETKHVHRRLQSFPGRDVVAVDQVAMRERHDRTRFVVRPTCELETSLRMLQESPGGHGPPRGRKVSRPIDGADCVEFSMGISPRRFDMQLLRSLDVALCKMCAS